MSFTSSTVVTEAGAVCKHAPHEETDAMGMLWAKSEAKWTYVYIITVILPWEVTTMYVCCCH